MGSNPTIEKTELVDMLRVPNNRKQVRQLLGIVNSYRKFIPGMAAMTEPIYALLKTNKKWAWNNLDEKAYQELRR